MIADALAGLSPEVRDALMAEVFAEAERRNIAKRMSIRGRELRGAMRDIRDARYPEVIISGPAGTGKSLGILDWINWLCWTYPRIRVLIVRKVRADLANSGLVTFERHVLGEDNPICNTIQRKDRRNYLYPNGSEIVVGGLDRETSVMSQEYDIIYVQEAIELTESEWESLSTRKRNYAMPFQMLIGDTNPGQPDHWILRRVERGDTKMYATTHEDNPAYWDVEKGDWTDIGRDYVLGSLERLTGTRKERLRFGRWVIAEGAVFGDWNPAIHVVEDFEIPAMWTRIRSIDFGFTNPFVCQWWAFDPDGRMYLYREIYRTERLVQDHAKLIKDLSKDERIVATVADHDAEDRATLERHGVRTILANKSISAGIQALQERMRIAGDGKPRFFILRSALIDPDPALTDPDRGDRRPSCTREEIAGIVWDDKKKKEQPIDRDNHGYDAARYAAMWWTDKKPVKVSKSNPFYGR